MIFLGGLRSDKDDAEVALEAFHSARALAGRGSFVTVSRFGRAAGTGALARTCAKEWPDAAVRAIEVEYEDGDTTGVAAAVAAELLTGDTEADVGRARRREQGRMDDAAEPVATVANGANGTGVPRRARCSAPESVVVITGGGRGVTAACARALAHSFRSRIALIGRTPLSRRSAGTARRAD